MSWSSGFVNALKKNALVMRYELRFHDNPTGPGGALSIFGGYGPELSAPDDVMISRDGPQISGTNITCQTWQVSFGGFSVPVVGDIRKYFPTIMRGAYAALYVEVGGIKERVAFGQLRTVSGTRGIWNLGFVDIISALAVTADATVDPSFALERFRWFYRTGNNTTLSSTYTGGISLIRLTTDANCEQETGEDGWIKISSTTQDLCYATWTSKAANVLTATSETIAQDTIYPSVNAIPAQSLTSETTITPMAMLQGKPWVILGKLLISREGLSTNTFDKYPASWTAQGNFPEDIYDDQDAARAADYIIANPGSTAYDWQIPIEAPWSSGFRVFVDVAAASGQFPVWRQNAVTWRGARVLENAEFEAQIHTGDIIEILSHEIFDPQTPNSYSFMKIAFQEKASGTEYKMDGPEFTTSGGVIETLPTLPAQEFDNRYLYKSTTQTSTDTSRQHMARGDIDRMIPWAVAPIESIVLRLPLHYSRLCAGDIVEIITQARFIHGYRDQPGLTNIWRCAMVTGVSVNFQNAACTVSFAIYGRMGDP